jgi:hypothetical protein
MQYQLQYSLTHHRLQQTVMPLMLRLEKGTTTGRSIQRTAID